MAMELLEGQSADAWLEAKQAAGGLPTLQEACNVLCQVLEGVAAAHSHDIVHRDLKPPNFFLTSTGVVKVLDFGIARHGDAHTRVTRTNAGMPGSPGYFAPEFGKGQPASAASDVYALGVSLFELLAGRWPFLGGGSTSEMVTLALLMQHATEPMPDVRALRADVPREVAEAILLAGSKRPDERPTADAFREALLPFAGAVPRPGRSTRSSSPTTPATATPRPPPGTSFGIAPMGQKVSATPARAPLSTAIGVKPMVSAPEQAPAVEPVAAQLPAPEPVLEEPPSRPQPAKRSRTLPMVAVFGLAVAAGLVAVAYTDREQPTPDAAPALPVVAPAPAKPPPPPVLPDGMVLVPSGRYPIGDDSGGFSSPRHEVELAAFAIDRFEVSIGDARLFLTATSAAGWAKLPPEAFDRKPVSNVSVEQAQSYCAWRVKGGALPTENQWEAAARGQAGRRFPWGE
jgi:hypothetical protein